VFSDRKVERPNLPDDQVLQATFDKPARDQAALNDVSGLFPRAQKVKTVWLDPAVPGVFRCNIEGTGEADEMPFRFRKLSFAKHRAEWPEQEEILFGYVSRKTLAAPTVVSSYRQGSYTCQIHDLTDWEPVPGPEWPDVQMALMCKIFSIQLPEAFIEAYRSGHQILPERISEQSVRKAKIAVDSNEESDRLEEFVEGLDRLTLRLNEVPLALVNSDLAIGNVLKRGEERLILNWFRWSLEPIGFVLPQRGADSDLEELLTAVRKSHKLLSEQLTVEHLRLVTACKVLDGALVRMAYKAAFGEMDKIMKSPLMTSS
jgi:hypothetical protein